jgi:hypothetical protein
MYNTNKILDTLLSRTADTALTVGQPKAWFAVADKQRLEEDGYDNDPTHPGFYQDRPPVYNTANAPKDNYMLYENLKTNAAKMFGASEVSYGETPSAAASGKLVDTLLAQTQVLVTGEPNLRLNAVLEDIVETKILMYKRFYTEPRYYFVRGNPVAVTLSKLLSTYQVEDPVTGEVTEKEIPEFQVTVAPDSNFPRNWERTLGFLMQLAGTPTADGKPLVSREAILDMLKERYPQLAPGGKFYKQSEALAVGTQVLQEKQQRQQDEDRLMKATQRYVQRRGLKEITSPAINVEIPENGNGSQGGA